MIDETRVDAERRGFLKALAVAGGAGAVAAVAPGVSAGSPSGAAPPASEAPRGYRETDHVRAYYASARV
jgi:FtsP/CotA-like multicopper oxidase with cupredoxin domain